MFSPRNPVAACAAALAPALVLASAAGAALPDRYMATAARIGGFVQLNQPDPAIRLADSLLADARGSGDRRAVAELLRIKGEVLARARRPAAASVLGEAIAAGRAVGDTALVLRAMYWRIATLDPQASAAQTREMRALAAAHRDTLYEALGLLQISFALLEAGDFPAAREGYARVVERLDAVGDRHSIPNALIGLGRAHTALGDFVGAREAHARALAIARETGSAWFEAHATNNLGTLEFMVGDPAAALPRYRRAAELQAQVGDHPAALVALVNVAIAHKHLGRFDDAAAALDEARSICEREGLERELPQIDIEAAGVLSLRGRLQRATDMFRRVLGRSDLTARERALSLRGIAFVLEREGRAAEALALVQSELPRLEPRMSHSLALDMRIDMARLAMGTGRWDQALRTAREADADAARLGLARARLDALAVISTCELEAGRNGAARRALESAAAVWATERNGTADPDWRMQRGIRGRLIFPPLARLEIDAGTGDESERVRRAFDLLQGYKARTLRERIRGPAATHPDSAPGAGAVVTLELLQRKVLGDGDLLLDAFLGPRVSLMFAVTRDSIRVIWLPGEADLTERVRALRALLSSRPGAAREPLRTEAVASAERALGRTLLGGLGSMLAGQRRIIFVADGVLNLVPLASLRDGAGEELVVNHVIGCIPSASLLADLAAGPPLPHAAPAAVVAIAGTTTSAGQRLEGAVREAQWVERHYAGPDVRTMGTGRSADPGVLAAGDVLHVAAHTTLNDLNPWRSSIRLDGPDSSSFITAAEIAALRGPARLAFLSGCESAGGRALSGEGVQGLSMAFLMAGTRTLVATLWPVDDAVTVRLVQSFYRSLDRGATVAEALNEAQRSLRSDQRTADPFFWAGFIVIGDGAATVPLRPRNGAPHLVMVSGAVLLIVGLLLWRRRNLRHRVISGGVERPLS